MCCVHMVVIWYTSHTRAGNEPDILAVHLFDYVGRADLTQKVS